ncbi:MAG: hypothetical protein ACKVT0_10935 [Planctomycetaceae bacterium]
MQGKSNMAEGKSDKKNVNYSSHQKKIIQRYYDNREQIDEERLCELVANLYLSSGAKRKKLWESARDLMLRLNVPEKRVEHVISTDNPALVAEVVKDLQAGNIPKSVKPTGKPTERSE